MNKNSSDGTQLLIPVGVLGSLRVVDGPPEDVYGRCDDILVITDIGTIVTVETSFYLALESFPTVVRSSISYSKFLKNTSYYIYVFLYV